MDNIIRNVGETLIQLLKDGFIGDPDLGIDSAAADELIVLASPADFEGDARLSLFLYQVHQNEFLNNWEMRQTSDGTLENPPLTLDLFYMLTVYPPPESSDTQVTDRTLFEHRFLGTAMRIFYDNGIVRGSRLQGTGLADTASELRIVLTTMSMENLTQMWGAFNGQPYRTSVFYQVTPVAIDSRRNQDADRVIEKDMGYYQMLKTRRES